MPYNGNVRVVSSHPLGAFVQTVDDEEDPMQKHKLYSADGRLFNGTAQIRYKSDTCEGMLVTPRMGSSTKKQLTPTPLSERHGERLLWPPRFVYLRAWFSQVFNTNTVNI